MVGIAVWGLGRHAFKNVLPAIVQFPEFELIGVCSRNPESRNEALNRWGGQSWASSAEMLRCSNVDIVYLATPTGLHFSHGMEVMRAHKHLICEKSLTDKLEHSQQLTDFARLEDLILCEALMFEYHPQFSALRNAVHDRDFGKVLHAFCCFNLPRLEKPGFRLNKELGGGALLDVGCYPLAMARALFGELTTLLHARLEFPASGEVDTAGDASLLFADGARADVTWGYNRAYAAEILVLGERQSVYVDRVFSKSPGMASNILLRDVAGTPRSIPVPAADGFVEMFRVVRDALGSADVRERLWSQASSQAKLIEEVRRCGK